MKTKEKITLIIKGHQHSKIKMGLGDSGDYIVKNRFYSTAYQSYQQALSEYQRLVMFA